MLPLMISIEKLPLFYTCPQGKYKNHDSEERKSSVIYPSLLQILILLSVG